MRLQFIIGATLAAALATAPAERVAANDALIGGIIGGAIGSVISNEAQRNRTTTRTTRTTTYRPSVSTAQREENRSVQRALNYFGFNAGGADGILGQRSRNAISSYQAHMGYPITGRLLPYEQQFLLTSHSRALSGGPATQTALARAGGITSALLIAWRDEATGGGASRYGGLPLIIAESVDEIANSSDPSGEQLIQRSGFIQLADMNGDGQTDYLIDTSVTGSAFWCNAQSCAVRVFVSTPNGYERNDFQAFNVTPAMFSCQRGLCQMTGGGATTFAAAPAPAAPAQPQTQLAAAAQAPQASIPVASAVPNNPGTPAPAAPAAAAAGLPTFFAKPAAEASLASHCNKISLMMTTNGGFTTVATMTDPKAALEGQFCLARTYAIANGERLIAKVTGVDASQIEAQCAGLSQALASATTALSLQDVATVRQEVAQVVLASGMAPAALADSARICLGVGYRTDNMDMALSSAILLVTVGNEPYAELLGHHLGQGFGVTERSDLSLAWYEVADTAIANGALPAFVPGQPERVALIRAAIDQLSGKSATQVVPVGGAEPAAALPLFSVSD
jgi:peptidoglycan hydrolase-like protein with peptidoglycan-binding domain